MKLGGLSGQEVENIKKILQKHSIPYEVKTDNEILNFNEESMQNNLRHFNAPNISTHILSIHIEDQDLESISTEAKQDLLQHGIGAEVPKELFEATENGSVLKEVNKGNHRLVGYHHLLLWAFSIVFLTLYYLYRE